MSALHTVVTMRHARASVSFMMIQISFMPYRVVPILHVALPIPFEIACSVTGAIHALPQQSDGCQHQVCPCLHLANSPEQIAAPLHESENETRRCVKFRIRLFDLLELTVRLSMPPQFFSYTPRC